MANQELQKQLAGWARQTIAFALSLTAQDDGQALDNPEQVLHAGKATERIVSELWQDTVKECPDSVRFTMSFVRRVLDWVEHHRHSKS